MAESDNNIEKKIKVLSAKLDTGNKPKETSKEATPNMSYAFKISAELIAGIAIGGFIGYYIDKFFITKPLFLIIFLFLGVAGSFLNIYKDIKNG